jgi:MarR family transcriptional regulator for hemolysin
MQQYGSDMPPDESVRKLRASFTRSLILASRRWKALADATMKSRDLSHATALVVIVIDSLGSAVTQIELAREIGIEGPTLVRLLDQLEKQGRIERRENPDDRRAKLVSLSRAGKDLVAEIQMELERLRDAAFADVDRRDIEAALRVFAAMRDFTRDRAEAAGVDE